MSAAMDISGHMFALQEAVVEGRIREIESILGSVSRVVASYMVKNSLDDDNTTLLHISANHPTADIVKQLLSHGAEVDWQNGDGFTALHVASLWGRGAVVRCLLEHGANPLIRDADGLMPVDHASDQGHLECVHLLEGHTLEDSARFDENHAHTGDSHAHSVDQDPDMSMAMAYASMYGSDNDITNITNLSPLSDYDFTPTPPTRQRSVGHPGSTHSRPSPCQKLVFSPPSHKSAESGDCGCHGDDSMLCMYTTAIDDSLLLREPAGKVGGADESISQGSPLNSTYTVSSSASSYHGNGIKDRKPDQHDVNKAHNRHSNVVESRKPDQQVDQLCDKIANLTTSTHKTGQTGSSCCTPSPLECSFVADIKVRVPEKLKDLTDGQLRERLVALGEIPGPITPSTKVAYLAYLAKLEDGVQPTGNKGYKGYKYELSLVLNGTVPLPDLSHLEKQVFDAFRTPTHPSRSHAVTPSPVSSHRSHNSSSSVPRQTTPLSPFKTPPTTSSLRAARDRGTKDHFNYLLLDPRVLEKLSTVKEVDGDVSSELRRFRVFVESVFYIGKGKNSRSMQHLKDAKDCFKLKKNKLSDKLRRIHEIWLAGCGVVSLQLFHNTTASEAFTREACLIDAIGIDMLTNVQKGHVYGDVSGWNLSRRRQLGVHLLYKAFLSYKLHPPQQIYHDDL